MLKNFTNTNTSHWLQNYGFEFCKNSVTGLKANFERPLNISDLYCLWISIDTEDEYIHYYLEYQCGGEVWSYGEQLSTNLINDEDSFMVWLDNEVETIKRCWS